MKLNTEYRFKSEASRQAFENRANQNVKFAKFMKDGFIVIDKSTTGSVTIIGIKNDNGGVDCLKPNTMGYNGGGPIISFTDDEYHYFEEVLPEEDRDYACLVLSDGAGGYLIRQHHCTKEEAEGFATRWLHDNPKDEVVIIRALARMTLKTTPSIVTSAF